MRLLSLVCACVIHIALLLRGGTEAFYSSSSVTRTSLCGPVRASGRGDGCPVVVVGLAGGVAESLSCKLVDSGFAVCTFLDRKPYSPKLLSNMESNKALVYCDKNFNQQLVEAKIPLGSTVVVVEDDGDEAIRTKISLNGDESTGEMFATKFAPLVPTSVRSVVYSAGVDADGGGGSRKAGLGARLFGVKGIDLYKSWGAQNSKTLSVFRYGRLIGGLPGLEPTPFMGLPLLEPELHPSYVLQSIICSTVEKNQYASSEVCTREALSEVISQLLLREDRKTPSNEKGIDSLVVSIAGPPLRDRDWDKLFDRMQSSGDVELLRVDFKSILKPQQLANWVCDSWFPQALIEADAATILTGSRPVRASQISPESIRVTWEDLQPDLTVRSAGCMEINIVTGKDGRSPHLTVLRLADGPLPGEGQLVDRLVEAINKSVYKKQFCLPVDA